MSFFRFPPSKTLARFWLVQGYSKKHFPKGQYGVTEPGTIWFRKKLLNTHTYTSMCLFQYKQVWVFSARATKSCHRNSRLYQVACIQTVAPNHLHLPSESYSVCLSSLCHCSFWCSEAIHRCSFTTDLG